MQIPSSKYLKNKARLRLNSVQEPKRVVFVYAAITFLTSLIVVGVRFALSRQISQTGGLQNIGLRSVLSTADSILPLLQTFIMLSLELGYTAAVLRFARNQYASPMTLKRGVERFWPLLRADILMGLIYAGVILASVYVGTMIFMLLPISNTFVSLITPYVTNGVAPGPEVLASVDGLVDQLLIALLPMVGIVLLLAAVVGLPIMYRYRLVNFVLVDRAKPSGYLAMRESQFLMRGHMWALVRLDLSFWWYYLLQFLASLLVHLDVIAAFLPFSLPVSGTALLFTGFIGYLAAEFVIFYFFKNQVSVTYALFYNTLSPQQKPEDSGVAIGNIFAQN